MNATQIKKFPMTFTRLTTPLFMIDGDSNILILDTTPDVAPLTSNKSMNPKSEMIME